MDLFIRNLIGTVVRWLLTVVATWLVSVGIVGAEDREAVITGVAFGLATLLWGIYQKFFAKRILDAALKLPAGSILSEAYAEAKSNKPKG